MWGKRKAAPASTGLGFNWAVWPGYQQEIWNRELVLQMRAYAQAGVSYAPGTMARMDLGSRGLIYVQPAAGSAAAQALQPSTLQGA